MNPQIQTPSQVIARLLPETNVALDLELASKRRVFAKALSKTNVPSACVSTRQPAAKRLSLIALF